MERQSLVPGERICMPKLFVNCKALSTRGIILGWESFFLVRDCFLFRELASGIGDFGGQFVGFFFSARVFSYQTFVEVRVGAWGFIQTHGAQIRRQTGRCSVNGWVISWETCGNPKGGG